MATVERIINTTEDLQDVLASIDLRNSGLCWNWKLNHVVVAGQVDVMGDVTPMVGWLVWASFDRPDTDNGWKQTGQSRRELIVSGASESSVVKTAWLLIKTTVEHELMEAFHYRSRRIFDPHNTVGELAEVQERKVGGQ